MMFILADVYSVDISGLVVKLDSPQAPPARGGFHGGGVMDAKSVVVNRAAGTQESASQACLIAAPFDWWKSG
jgi:hypothetical protein